MINAAKRILSTFILAVIILVLAVLVVRGSGKEDTWICEDGQWVRHGSPSTDQPTKECKDVWYN